MAYSTAGKAKRGETREKGFAWSVLHKFLSLEAARKIEQIIGRTGGANISKL